jgi:branched-chain amino acid transport system ATP-binding protein
MAQSEPVLRVEKLNAFYGRAHVLHDVSFEMGSEPVAIVGRNGMGKTTLCNAIVGIPPARTLGSIRFDGQELVGRPSYKITQSGIGYVPQGRRLFQSLTTDEHLRMVGGKDGRWTIEKVYDLFPRLAERRRVSGTQLSGGEQQMLAIARALLLNPKLLIMDEPSEGLAPIIIQTVWQAVSKLKQQGLSILLVEQNAALALQLVDHVHVMSKGRVVYSGSPQALWADDAVKSRFLGI